MILYKDGRLYYKSVSFPMPNGFYVNYQSGVEYEAGMAFCNEDESIVIEWDTFECEEGVDSKLNRMVSKAYYRIIIPVTEVDVNGFSGYYCLYKDSTRQYFEMHLDIGDDEVLSFCVEANGPELKEILEEPFYRDLIQGIRREE